jgi:predicted metalloendopeptidase
MRMMTRSFLVAVGCLAAACSAPASAPDAPPLVSGIHLSASDDTVRPQDDLFHHVNGGWLARTEIPADRSSWGAFDILLDKSQNDLRAIAEEAAAAPDRAPGSDAQKIGDFYESFLNEARAEELGLTPLAEELAAIDALKTKTDLARHFARFFKMNLINPVVGYVDGDAQQPTHDILYLYQGGLGLPDREYYLKDDPTLKEYREKYVIFAPRLCAAAPKRSQEVCCQSTPKSTPCP